MSEWCSQSKNSPFSHINGIEHIVECQWSLLHASFYSVEIPLNNVGVVMNKNVNLNTTYLNEPPNKRHHKTVACLVHAGAVLDEFSQLGQSREQVFLENRVEGGGNEGSKFNSSVVNNDILDS